jgi:ABC-type Fe3+/spermidine/putrescine transport system ATPase subunit
VPPNRRGFGMVFQSYAIWPHMDVFGNASFPLRAGRQRLPRKAIEDKVMRVLHAVGLDALADRPATRLSGGQQQRLALARTIVLEPGLLLLDEPLSNLDTKLRNEMRVEIKRLHEELNLTTLYVTHDQSEAMSMSDLVLVMRLGNIEQLGTPQEIYNSPNSLYVADFMGYVNKLEVEIAGREGDEWLVRLPGQAAGATLHCKTTLKDANWKTGDKVLACSRPDETLVDPLPPSNHLQGAVTLVEYMGKAFEGLVNLDDSDQQVMAHSQRLLEQGQRIEFGIRPDRLLLFPIEENAGLTTPALGSPSAEPALKGQTG